MLIGQKVISENVYVNCLLDTSLKYFEQDLISSKVSTTIRIRMFSMRISGKLLDVIRFPFDLFNCGMYLSSLLYIVCYVKR